MTKFKTDKKAHALKGTAALNTAACLTLLFTDYSNANGNKSAMTKYKGTFDADGNSTATVKVSAAT